MKKRRKEAERKRFFIGLDRWKAVTNVNEVNGVALLWQAVMEHGVRNYALDGITKGVVFYRF